VTNEQFYIVIFAPVLLNALITCAIFGVFMSMIHERFTDLKTVWRSELQRVEGVLDARLKHLEEMEGR